MTGYAAVIFKNAAERNTASGNRITESRLTRFSTLPNAITFIFTDAFILRLTLPHQIKDLEGDSQDTHNPNDLR